MKTQEREKQVAIAFADYQKMAKYLSTDVDWDAFIKTNQFQSIPQPEPSIPVSVVRARIEELRGKATTKYSVTYNREIFELTKLLEAK